MTNIRMCDNCKQMLKDAQPVYLTINIGGYSFGLDCHIDCVPDWVRTFHEEQTAKAKKQGQIPVAQYNPSGMVTF